MAQIKKILYVCSVYRPNTGGVEISVEQMCRYFKGRGVAAAVLTKRYPFDLPEVEEYKGSPIVRITRPKERREYENTLIRIGNYGSLLRPDLIHVVGIRRPMPYIALLLARRWQVPLMMTVAGGDVVNEDEPETLRGWEEGKDKVPESVAQADLVTAYSNDLAELTIKAIPQLKEKPGVELAGIDYRRIKKIKAKKMKFSYIMAARRLERAKGIDVLIKSFAMISPKYPDLHLMIIGDGELRDNLEQLAVSLGVENRVHFTGSVDQEEVVAYMKGAVSSVCPSRTEGGGIVNFEAEAAGTVAIGSRVGGIPQYIKDGKTGWLFESENVNDLARVLTTVLGNEKEVVRVTKQGQIEAKRYDWTKVGERLEKTYKTLVKNFRPQGIRTWDEDTKYLCNKLHIPIQL